MRQNICTQHKTQPNTRPYVVLGEPDLRIIGLSIIQSSTCLQFVIADLSFAGCREIRADLDGQGGRVHRLCELISLSSRFFSPLLCTKFRKKYSMLPSEAHCQRKPSINLQDWKDAWQMSTVLECLNEIARYRLNEFILWRGTRSKAFNEPCITKLPSLCAFVSGILFFSFYIWH